MNVFLFKAADQNLESPRYDQKHNDTQLTIKTKNLVMNSLITAVSPTYHQARSSTDYGYDLEQNDKIKDENNYRNDNYDSSIYSNDESNTLAVKNLSPGSSSLPHQSKILDFFTIIWLERFYQYFELLLKELKLFVY